MYSHQAHTYIVDHDTHTHPHTPKPSYINRGKISQFQMQIFQQRIVRFVVLLYPVEIENALN